MHPRRRTFTRRTSSARLAAAALGASVAACTAGNDAHPPHEVGPEAGVTPDASSVDAASAGGTRAIKLTWQVAASPLFTTEGLGDAGSGAGVDAASDAATGPNAGSPEAGASGYRSLPGVKVCVYRNAAIPCATTDNAGVFTISGLPVVSNVVLSFRRDGYVPVLTAVATPDTDIDGVSGAGTPLLMPSATDPSTTPVPVDIASKGMVTVVAVLPGASGGPTDSTGDVGAKITLSPMTGNGPYFLDPTNTAIVPSATSLVYDGAVYFNLDPGDYEITIDDANHSCSPLSSLLGLYGYPAPPTSVRFPIVAGYSTSAVGFYCTPKSVVVSTADAN